MAGNFANDRRFDEKTGKAVPYPARALQVFLCHSSDDKAAVRNLRGQLLRDGFAPWLDESSLLPGQDWESVIREALLSSQVVVVCLSASFTRRSGYVQKEIDLALDIARTSAKKRTKIYVIPARLEECEVPKRFRRHFGRIQSVDLFREGGYKKLVDALNYRRSVGEPPSPWNTFKSELSAKWTDFWEWYITPWGSNWFANYFVFCWNLAKISFIVDAIIIVVGIVYLTVFKAH